MKLIVALSILGATAAAAVSGGAGHHSLRHRSLQDACPDDVKECKDGSFVNRNPDIDCEFEPCPEVLPAACNMDVKECEDGSFVDRDPDIGCEFTPCPEEIACAADVRECDDGSYVSRDPANGCAFRPCPEKPPACPMDVFECDDGIFVNRDPAKDCAFEACPKVCTGEDGETYMAPCEGIDGMFCIGESYTALDGCNTCSCGNMDGLAKCTAMFCPPVPEKVEKDEAPKTCLVNGLDLMAGETFTAPDGCNTCTCTDTGDSACTEMACEPCTTCDDGSETYCVGESYLSSDGCNTCSCSENGLSACTMMACPPKEDIACTMDVFECPDGTFVNRDPAKDCAFEACPEAPKTCLVNGLEIEAGQSYTAPDGCNTCTCTDTGGAACTKMACEPCSTCDGDDGNTYCAGESFLSGDGCNTCRCSDTGAASCTKMACPPKDEATTMDMEKTTTMAATCLVNGLEIQAGETYLAADGCNTCTCSGGDKPDACTMMACEPCTTCDDGSETYCVGESYLSSDGCNTCSCSENGLSACTMMACPPKEDIACTMDVFECPDGTFMNRDPAKDCAFEACPEAPKTCLVNGLEIEAGQSYTAPDGCNTCTCTDTGNAACTKMACEPCSTCDGDDGNTYCAGESFLSGDGCNTCRCSDTGAASCTKMACPPKDETTTMDMEKTTCLVNGLEVMEGETYVAADGCNTCTCSGGDTHDACTMMACEPCTTCDDGSETYCVGESYLSSDGCNTCSCSENGLSACTMMACPPVESEPENLPEVATCIVLGVEYSVGETYVAADGCNTCTCSGGDAPDACTMMACPDIPTPDDAPGPEVMKTNGDPPVEDDTTSGAILASVGLSAIVAIGSFLGATIY